MRGWFEDVTEPNRAKLVKIPPVEMITSRYKFPRKISLLSTTSTDSSTSLPPPSPPLPLPPPFLSSSSPRMSTINGINPSVLLFQVLLLLAK